MYYFEIIGEIREKRIIAAGRAIRESPRLRRTYGKPQWRKYKGVGRISLIDGAVCEAELHWHEAHGVGKRETKIKRLLHERDETQKETKNLITDKIAVCARNPGYEASLELGKAYAVIRDPGPAQHGYLRVIDESGADYLYPAYYFSIR